MYHPALFGSLIGSITARIKFAAMYPQRDKKVRAWMSLDDKTKNYILNLLSSQSGMPIVYPDIQSGGERHPEAIPGSAYPANAVNSAPTG